MSADLRAYFNKLEKKEDFTPLLTYFIHTSIAEQYSIDDKIKQEISYSTFYEQFVESVFMINSNNVFEYCQSPIERIFLNSFMLLFLKNSMPCLFITPPFKDTEKELEHFRNHYQDIDRFIDSYKTITGDTDLLHFGQRLKEKEEDGKMSSDDIEDILMYQGLRKVFEFDSYHITPQAAFPNYKVADKSIRTDFLIWVPNDPSVKIIVECDGFDYHTSKRAFTNDKIRDRLFQQNGYRVLRYSGSEIFQDPIKVSSDLFDLLQVLDLDEKKTRMT